MKEGFKSIEEILKEVGEEEGLSLTEMKDVWEHQKKYVEKQMNEEGVYAIFLPFIGTLCLNVKQFKKELRGKTREFYKDFIDKVEKLVNHENYKEFSNPHKKVTGINKLTRYIVKNYETGIDRSKNLIVRTKCWEIISKYSNKVFEKRKEPITRNKNND